MNLLMNYSRPINHLSSLRFLGGGISVMAFALFGSISIPLLLTINPKSLPEETPKMHFLGFILRLCSQDRWRFLPKFEDAQREFLISPRYRQHTLPYQCGSYHEKLPLWQVGR